MFEKGDKCVICGEPRTELNGKEIIIENTISKYMPSRFTNDDLWMQSNAWGFVPTKDAIFTNVVTNGPYYVGWIGTTMICTSATFLKLQEKKSEEKEVVLKEDITKVNIKGLDKVAILKELWNAQKPALFFIMQGINAPQFSKDNAKKAVNDYIDYFDGRCIQTDISGDEADGRSYDKNTSSGTFIKCIENVRKMNQK